MQNETTRRLDRKQASEFLTNLGFKTAPTTLAKYACLGGGPEFESFGRKPLYREDRLLDWAHSRTSAPKRSTSDTGEAEHAAA